MWEGVAVVYFNAMYQYSPTMTKELTCHNSLGLWQSGQHMFDEAHICAGLQIAYTFP